MFVRDIFADKVILPLGIQLCKWMQGHSIEGLILPHILLSPVGVKYVRQRARRPS